MENQEKREQILSFTGLSTLPHSISPLQWGGINSFGNLIQKIGIQYSSLMVTKETIKHA